METIIPISGMLLAIVLNVIVFGTIILVVKYIVQARNKERMALIEKGVDLSEFYTKKKDGENNILKFALLFIGIGLGLFLGFVLADFVSLPTVAVVISVTLLFGGISLLLYHWINNRKEIK